jgi:multicomponent K+:H+ antiporter subunit A
VQCFPSLLERSGRNACAAATGVVTLAALVLLLSRAPAVYRGEVLQAHIDRLEQQGRPIKFVYFLEEGIGSIVVKMAPGRDAEAGIPVHEGMTGTVAVLGGDLAP